MRSQPSIWQTPGFSARIAFAFALLDGEGDAAAEGDETLPGELAESIVRMRLNLEPASRCATETARR